MADVPEKERTPVPFHVIINPQLTLGAGMVEHYEGCLSLEGFLADGLGELGEVADVYHQHGGEAGSEEPLGGFGFDTRGRGSGGGAAGRLVKRNRVGTEGDAVAVLDRRRNTDAHAVDETQHQKSGPDARSPITRRFMVNMKIDGLGERSRDQPERAQRNQEKRQYLAKPASPRRKPR